MSDQATAEDFEGAEADVKVGGGMSSKALVLFIVLPILLLFVGLGGAYFAGLLDPLLGVPKEAAEAETRPAVEVTPSVFYDLPEMLVNLNTGGRKASYLKISVSLEVEDEASVEQIEQVMPRIIDNFQVYLRELRVEDLSGSAGLQRLREELLLRVNAATQPTVVKSVLFKEMLVQ